MQTVHRLIRKVSSGELLTPKAPVSKSDNLLSSFERAQALKVADAKTALTLFNGSVKNDEPEALKALHELADIICAEPKYYRKKYYDSLYKAACEQKHIGAAQLLYAKIEKAEIQNKQLDLPATCTQELRNLKEVIDTMSWIEETKHISFRLEDSDRGRNLGLRLKETNLENRQKKFDLLLDNIVSESEEIA